MVDWAINRQAVTLPYDEILLPVSGGRVDRAGTMFQGDVIAKNSGNTRIFTLGVGDDVNAAMLDQLADATRAVSTYVRPAEDIETKVASLYGKISNPVMTMAIAYETLSSAPGNRQIWRRAKALRIIVRHPIASMGIPSKRWR